ncbi:MAG: peptidyl-prolyl cis-trans isomerase, partial [Candidatus Riflebacteria bacterium]|nr:peptidyl-prolyl cis-trans isomerase [Candidatus Riflebacteria bacterium]
MSDLKNVIALKVNDTPVTLDQLLWRMKVSGDLQEVLKAAAREMVVLEAARKEGFTASDKEIGDAVAAVYASLGAASEAQALEALKASGLGKDDVKRYVESIVIARKLKDSITRDRVPGYYKEHWEEFEVAELSEIAVMDDSLARELFTQLTEEGADFEEIAEKHSILEESRANGGYTGEQIRADLPQEVREPIFSATPGSIVGPFKVEKKHFIVQVEDVTKAEL